MQSKKGVKRMRKVVQHFVKVCEEEFGVSAAAGVVVSVIGFLQYKRSKRWNFNV